MPRDLKIPFLQFNLDIGRLHTHPIGVLIGRKSGGTILDYLGKYPLEFFIMAAFFFDRRRTDGCAQVEVQYHL